MKELFLALWAFLGLVSPALPSPAPTTSPLPQQAQEIKFEDKIYTVYWYEVQNAEGLMLKANFDQQESALTLQQKNNCEFLVNAGFYSTDNKPIGMWQSEQDKLFTRPEENQLFNGYVYRTGDVVFIGDLVPKVHGEWALQTGPILRLNGENRKLAIRNDKPRRRMIAATDNGSVMFFAITLKNSDFEGPYLEDLPKILGLVGVKIKDAINLDGGSASALLTPDVSLHEANPIGSFFCYNLDNDTAR